VNERDSCGELITLRRFAWSFICGRAGSRVGLGREAEHINHAGMLDSQPTLLVFDDRP
jgi:hypothetical protein